jgi:hypothetical protein
MVVWPWQTPFANLVLLSRAWPSVMHVRGVEHTALKGENPEKALGKAL